MLLQVILIIISIPSPLALSFQAQNLPFLQIIPTLFLFRTGNVDSLDCLLVLLSISVFFTF